MKAGYARWVSSEDLDSRTKTHKPGALICINLKEMKEYDRNQLIYKKEIGKIPLITRMVSQNFEGLHLPMPKWPLSSRISRYPLSQSPLLFIGPLYGSYFL
jgi:hypothetical protein